MDRAERALLRIERAVERGTMHAGPRRAAARQGRRCAGRARRHHPRGGTLDGGGRTHHRRAPLQGRLPQRRGRDICAPPAPWSTPRAARRWPASAPCPNRASCCSPRCCSPTRSSTDARSNCPPAPTRPSSNGPQRLAERLESLADALEQTRRGRLDRSATGTARYEATKIPEAIKYPRGLSLSGPLCFHWGPVHMVPT